jgi:hypothetical protein
MQDHSVTKSLPSNQKKGLPNILVVLMGFGAVGFVAMTLGSLILVVAIVSARNYLEDKYTKEGKESLTTLGKGIVACAASKVPSPGGSPLPIPGTNIKVDHALPPTSDPVPASIASIQGQKYASTAADWTSQQAFACAQFSMSEPQYFQYQWQRKTNKSGTIRAIADLEGTGKPGIILELDITCSSPGVCSMGTIRTIKLVTNKR